ncbi:hypothetical protein B0H66DRAFT_539203 [Apodospora peruviana]|uniref:Uncharacterized protein n=1 Tax=Apodospora peruviana TaxID=516989 RepID=A0AAE0IPF1_9PEZI|nr:hypothetical protein B0H66DRAFT_539203 [Apodospora peruviana]
MYDSFLFNSEQRNYVTYKRELFAMVAFCRHQHRHLFEAPGPSTNLPIRNLPDLASYGNGRSIRRTTESRHYPTLSKDRSISADLYKFIGQDISSPGRETSYTLFNRRKAYQLLNLQWK